MGILEQEAAEVDSIENSIEHANVCKYGLHHMVGFMVANAPPLLDHGVSKYDVQLGPKWSWYFAASFFL